jgi:peptidoglycan/LPS O-acetylase OafA/YrhL
MSDRLYLTHDEMAARRGVVPSLDGLRALSIIVVICSHAVSKLFPGGMGVYIFFVISGFLITRLLLVEYNATNTISVPLFYARRILRLYPVIIVFCGIAIGLYAVLGRSYSLLEPASALGYFANYYYDYLESHKFPITMPSFEVFWSLSVEEHFYLLFPVTFLLIKGDSSRLIRVLIWLCIGCLGLRLIMKWLYPDIHMESFYGLSQYRLDSIGFGVILALLCEAPRSRLFLLRLSSPMWAATAAIVLMSCLLVRDQWFRDTIRYSIEGCAIGVLVAAILFGDRYKLVQWFLNTAILVWIGRLSYSLYVWHDGVISFLPSFGLPGWQQSVVSLGASLGVAALSYYAVEQPFLKLRKYLRYGQNDETSKRAEVPNRSVRIG